MAAERLKGIAAWTAVIALWAGMSFASYKSNLTDVILRYDWAYKTFYHHAHRQYPYLVWTDYGNPGPVDSYVNDSAQQVAGSAAGGLAGLVAFGSMTCLAAGWKEKRRYRDK
ncbi:MAG: hypothetical protein ACOCWQ_05630 [Nanoarchaeota archaeon]